MSIDQHQNRFPARPLEDYEKLLISELCGGDPLTNPEGIDRFFKTSVEPIMAPGRLKYILPLVGSSCAQTLGAELKTGTAVFLRGASLYAGVLATVNNLSAVPCRTFAVKKLLNGSMETDVFGPHDAHKPSRVNDSLLIQKAYDRISDEAQSFRELLDNASVALGITDDQSHTLAVVGAGVVHVLSSDSLTQVSTIEELEYDHPDLRNTDKIFEEIVCNFNNQTG